MEGGEEEEQGGGKEEEAPTADDRTWKLDGEKEHRYVISKESTYEKND